MLFTTVFRQALELFAYSCNKFAKVFLLERERDSEIKCEYGWEYPFRLTNNFVYVMNYTTACFEYYYRPKGLR